MPLLILGTTREGAAKVIQQLPVLPICGLETDSCNEKFIPESGDSLTQQTGLMGIFVGHRSAFGKDRRV